MTPPTVADVVPRTVADVPRAVAKGVPSTTDVEPTATPELAFPTAPTDVVSPIALTEGLLSEDCTPDPVAPAEPELIELLAPESELQVCLDVIDSDVVVTISFSLLTKA